MLMRFHSSSWIAFSDDWKAHLKAATSEISPFVQNLFARNLKASRKWKWLRGKRCAISERCGLCAWEESTDPGVDEILSKLYASPSIHARQAKCVLISDGGLGIQWQQALLGLLCSCGTLSMLIRFIVRSTVFYSIAHKNKLERISFFDTLFSKLLRTFLARARALIWTLSAWCLEQLEDEEDVKVLQSPIACHFCI